MGVQRNRHGNLGMAPCGQRHESRVSFITPDHVSRRHENESDLHRIQKPKLVRVERCVLCVKLTAGISASDPHPPLPWEKLCYLERSRGLPHITAARQLGRASAQSADQPACGARVRSCFNLPCWRGEKICMHVNITHDTNAYFQRHALDS